MSSDPNQGGYSAPPLSKEQVDRLLKAEPDPFWGTVYTDRRSSRPRNDQTRIEFRQQLEDKFQIKLSESVERVWDLPSVILQRPNDEYLRILVEARELFILGYFYSCVAMCGIVGERLVKDLIRISILVSIDGMAVRPSDAAFNQFERVDARALVEFVNKARLLSDNAKQAAVSLIELRNDYAHARGKNPNVNALKSITKLHVLVEDTVSVLKNYEIIDGQVVPRPANT